MDFRLFEASGLDLIQDRNDFIVTDGKLKLRILRRFAFDHSSMTMSCIVEDLADCGGARFVFVKGTFEALRLRSKPHSVPEDFMQRATSIARQGLYVLAMGFKAYLASLIMRGCGIISSHRLYEISILGEYEA